MVAQRCHSVVPLLSRVEEAAESRSHILSKLVHLLPCVIESISDVLTKVLEPLTHVLSKLTDLLEEVRWVIGRRQLVRDLVGDLCGDGRGREVIGKDGILSNLLLLL